MRNLTAIVALPLRKCGFDRVLSLVLAALIVCAFLMSPTAAKAQCNVGGFSTFSAGGPVFLPFAGVPVQPAFVPFAQPSFTPFVGVPVANPFGSNAFFSQQSRFGNVRFGGGGGFNGFNAGGGGAAFSVQRFGPFGRLRENIRFNGR